MRTITRLKTPCGHCKGTGSVVLTGVYADTYALLRRQSAPLTAADLAPAAGCKPTAMCNRLSALERMGFAVSQRYGRKRLYRAVKEIN
jgi:hypothetical protein